MNPLEAMFEAVVRPALRSILTADLIELRAALLVMVDQEIASRPDVMAVIEGVPVVEE